MNESEVIQIAKDYIERQGMKEMPIVGVSYKAASESGVLFENRATWTVTFDVNCPPHLSLHDVFVHVDELTGEAWEWNTKLPRSWDDNGVWSGKKQRRKK